MQSGKQLIGIEVNNSNVSAIVEDLTKKNNMPSIALTDNNNMFGVLEFSIECIKQTI